MTSAPLTVISQTANSTIYCYGEGNNRMAIKTVPSDNVKLAAHLRNESSFLKKLNHPNVVRMFKYEQNLISNGNTTISQSKTVKNSLVLEFASKATLRHCISQLEFTTLIGLFSQLCEGVSYLHSKDICHRDIKLDNILVCQEDGKLVPKIADFGFATVCRKAKKTILFNQYKGTRQGYMAPEIFAVRNNSSLQYDGKLVDIFALGVILFTLVFRKLPFQEANPNNKLYKLLIDKKYSQFWNFHGAEKKQIEIGNLQELKQLFISMTTNIPQERPSICQITQNSWIKRTILERGPGEKQQQIKELIAPINA